MHDPAMNTNEIEGAFGARTNTRTRTNTTTSANTRTRNPAWVPNRHPASKLYWYPRLHARPLFICLSGAFGALLIPALLGWLVPSAPVGFRAQKGARDGALRAPAPRSFAANRV
uniref:Uncharacterized protein n=1 Tax=Placozoa sp. H2 TaxID=573895 RepID=A0A7I6N5Z9_9METZ|nr:hypothetical protein [Placozoa sp. H2 HM-2017]